jgi:AraC-like DNA-binding protein
MAKDQTQDLTAVTHANDRLDALLQRFSVQAQLFHAGPLCGLHVFPACAPYGQLHLLRTGALEVKHAGAKPTQIAVPSLLFYPRPFEHRFQTDPTQGAELACANFSFGNSAQSPLALALPNFVVLPLSQLDSGLTHVLELLFSEAFGARCGRLAVVNRLFEVILVHILRVLLSAEQLDGGLLAGLSHPKLALALNAMHATPARPWRLESLAELAHMSRSSFAALFHSTLKITPGDYLLQWRMCVAQDALRRGRSLAQVQTETGYTSAATFTRAFKAHAGVAPKAWLARNQR